MKEPFDIFWFSEGGPNWVRSADTIEKAKSLIKELPLAKLGSYGVLDHRTGSVVSFAVNRRLSGAKTGQS
jgi:hypothetical protein